MALHDDDRKNCVFDSIIAQPRNFCKRLRIEAPARTDDRSVEKARGTGVHKRPARFVRRVPELLCLRVRSTIATPWPPPIHALTIPNSFFWRFSGRSASRIFPPVALSGDRARRPQGFSFSMSNGISLACEDLRGEASLISMISYPQATFRRVEALSAWPRQARAPYEGHRAPPKRIRVSPPKV